ALLRDIDWRTLGTLLMMLTVLEGFKRENVLRPVIRLAGRLLSRVICIFAFNRRHPRFQCSNTTVF
ncbi:MAG: hypothetical protein II387_07865, partial [Oscillospiraceae bacterium]|nr:hypothetical protein [Oscillospiraceae bacterium]